MDAWQKYQDAAYLRGDQYQNSGNLGARAELHRLYSTAVTPWHEWVFAQLALQPSERVLECGGGPGWLWRENLPHIPPDCQITLTDLSPGMVAEAAQALAGHPAFQFQTANIQELPFPDGAFDVVIANHMLYHVPDRARAYAEVKRVLTPHGRFLAATNGNAHMRELRQLGRHLMRQLLPTTDTSWMERPLFASHELPFRLENGHAELAPWFAQVILHPFADALHVTAATPLIAYLLSATEVRAVITDDLYHRLEQAVTAQIAQQGAIYITKDVGLFVVQK